MADSGCSNNPFTAGNNTKRIITAAIDLGTTFSGYAYGFQADLERDPPLITTNNWNDGSRISSKSPTTVLFDPYKTFHSFGFAAEEKYASLTENNQHENWFYFRQFKMTLHSTGNLCRTTQLQDECGKHMLALVVFTAAIKFLRDHLVEVISKRLTTTMSEDIQWVLTVPAIWCDAAKQFMREAAQGAGIPEDQLIIALEPEAASVYCQKVAMERSVFPDGARLTVTAPSSTFIIVDLGGGTADVTVLEKVSVDTLRQIHKASGGAWGGTKVDECFLEFLAEILGGTDIGGNILTAFKKNHMEEYTDLMRDFEIKKRDERITQPEFKFSVRIPSALVELAEAERGLPFSDILKMSRYGSSISKPHDKLRIESSTFASFFEAAIESIVVHLKKIFEEERVSYVDTIIMVGGFSSSTLMQESLKESFPQKKIIIPDEPDLSVLKGAVVYGFNPASISSRITRFTYGVDIVVGSLDDPLIPNYFLVLVESGQSIQVGEVKEAKQLNPLIENQTKALVEIYASPEKNPASVTDPGCQKLGMIEVEMPDTTGGGSRNVSFKMYFAGTEMAVEAVDETTGRMFTTRVNFLG